MAKYYASPETSNNYDIQAILVRPIGPSHIARRYMFKFRCNILDEGAARDIDKRSTHIANSSSLVECSKSCWSSCNQHIREKGLRLLYG